ncbi:signal peptidase II [Arthrobacter sp. MSA 4-2]|uniref:signal peptidase II n=1 Tax=Arthrobacter sp. MSA 4-2 TaxID=2794349 RepID=UPI0018E71819|nr:signal peptidase II [Arthrobacter sp. MSA 4-2]MBJ2122146.1 signal peptidase II [Arthrobacter sp. MSA 4-2]
MSENPPAEQTPAETKRTDGPGHSKRVRARYAVLLLVCMLAAYVLDQVTKAWVVSTMTEGQVTPVLPPLLNWHFIRNPGAAFSIGTNVTWVFTIIQALVSLAILTQIRKVASWGWAAALGLVLGGALGNLTDRLFREPSFGQGHVVDFIALPNFAIFNIADSAVVSGVILVCLMTLRGIGMDGRRSSESAAGDSAAGDSSAGESPAADRAAGTGPDTPRPDGNAS